MDLPLRPPGIFPVADRCSVHGDCDRGHRVDGGEKGAGSEKENYLIYIVLQLIQKTK